MLDLLIRFQNMDRRWVFPLDDCILLVWCKNATRRLPGCISPGTPLVPLHRALLTASPAKGLMAKSNI